MGQPNILMVSEIIDGSKQVARRLPDGRYVPARPLPFYGMRSYLRALWLVATGKGDVVLWEGQ